MSLFKSFFFLIVYFKIFINMPTSSKAAIVLNSKMNFQEKYYVYSTESFHCLALFSSVQ